MSRLLEIQQQISGDVGSDLMQPCRRLVRTRHAVRKIRHTMQTGHGTLHRLLSKNVLGKKSRPTRVFLFNDLV